MSSFEYACPACGHDQLIVLIATDGTIAFASAALHGLVPGLRLGEPFLDSVSESGREGVRDELGRVAAGDSVAFEAAHPGRDGRDVSLEYQLAPAEGAMAMGIGRVRGVEPASRLGDELKRARAELRSMQAKFDKIELELASVPFIDPLTGLWNSTQVVDRLHGEWSRGERSGDSIACLMIDVEGLDEPGGRGGDVTRGETLKLLAAGIKDTVRTYDIAGCDHKADFVVIAAACDFDRADRLAQRIRAGASGEPIQVDGRSVTPRFRIGGCTRHSKGVEEMEDLLPVAREALAEARRRDVPIHIVGPEASE